MLGKTEKVILALILLSGQFSVFTISGTSHFSNDELSALARLNSDSFSDSIMNGVRLTPSSCCSSCSLARRPNVSGNALLWRDYRSLWPELFHLFHVPVGKRI